MTSPATPVGRPWKLARLALLAAAPLLALAGGAFAAENFVCGPGGRPDPKTARCTCPAGKVERTSGGTSRCADATPTKPTTTATGAPTNPTSPTSPTAAPTPALSCPPTQFPTARGCVDRCAPSELYRDHLCVPRCRADESWSGSGCVRASAPSVPGVPRESPGCTDGRAPDATGHCCFAGQVWGEQSGRCRGAPRCPAGTLAEGETCAIDCEQGMQRAGDGVHCCWPGQEWSGATRECIGVAACPEGFELGPDGCHALRLCEPGKLAVDADHCCWPGQHWMLRDDGEAGCSGVPACPAPMIAQGDACFPPGQLREHDDRVERSADWGAQSLTLDVGYGFSSSKDGAHVGAFALGASWHLAALPLRLGAGLQFGGWTSSSIACADPAATCGDATGRATTYFASAAFAPLSLPNLAKETSSFLNPFVGLEARLTSYTQNDVTRALPAAGSSLGLVLGDAIFFKPLVLTVAWSIGLVGADARPSTALSLTIGYATKTSLDLR